MKFLLFLLAFITPTLAQTYPDRPVKIIVPFGAGGIADITVRIVAIEMSQKLGQPFVIENVPGAGGVAAARAAISNPQDGHTLLLLTNGAAVSKALFKQLAYDPQKDFTPISMLGTFDFFLAANSEKYKNLSDILAKPDGLNIATIAVGSTQNLTARLFLHQAKTPLTIIPYRGTPDAITGLLRSDSHLLVEGYSTLKSMINEGKFTVVASTGAKRSPLTPNAPTLSEVIKQPFDVTSWNALAAPSGLKPDQQILLSKTINEILARSDIKAKLLDLGIEPAGSTPRELEARLTSDIAKWEGIITTLGVEKQ